MMYKLFILKVITDLNNKYQCRTYHDDLKKKKKNGSGSIGTGSLLTNAIPNTAYIH